MSKTDAIRAMKLARLEEQRRSAPAPAPRAAAARPAVRPEDDDVRPGGPATPRAATKAAKHPAAAPRPSTPRVAASDVAAPDASDPGALALDLVPEALCGHTAISGRRCTRPQGHAEKNHRYAT